MHSWSETAHVRFSTDCQFSTLCLVIESRSSPLLYNGIFKFQYGNMVTSLKSELVKVMVINLEYSILGIPVALASNTLDISL